MKVSLISFCEVIQHDLKQRYSLRLNKDVTLKIYFNMTYITQTATNQNYTTSLKMQMSDMERDYLFIQNELTDTLRPSIAIIDFTYVIAELLEKNVEYVTKNGLTANAKESRDKLLYLMNIGETFNKLSAENQKLKLYNRTILAENQALIKELKEIKRQEMLAKSL